jgi:23S rRNA (pseudouridine1915-N3)-methyltransferase
MKILMLCPGKTTGSWLSEGIAQYAQRLQHYACFEIRILPDLKNVRSMPQQQKLMEAQQILAAAGNAQLWLLDEHGRQYSSVEFACFLQKKMMEACKNICFVIGGAYGFADSVYAHAAGQISLSCMTFSHQMVRLFFVEQLYRAFTIIGGEPYHHS